MRTLLSVLLGLVSIPVWFCWYLCARYVFTDEPLVAGEFMLGLILYPMLGMGLFFLLQTKWRELRFQILFWMGVSNLVLAFSLVCLTLQIEVPPWVDDEATRRSIQTIGQIFPIIILEGLGLALTTTALFSERRMK